MSLGHITQEEASKYILEAHGDDLDAALALAYDRAGDESPDAIEVHHALFLIRRALNQPYPSWEDTRVELRRRQLFP